MGSAVQADLLTGDTAYRGLALRQFNILTPENEFKFEATEPKPGKFDFTAGDSIAELAQKQGIKIRGHTLVWYRALPAWTLRRGLRADVVLKRHIHEVVSHYEKRFTGTVIAWDVVNEALDSNNRLRKDWPWRAHRGEDSLNLLVRAFKWARASAPHAKLFYNDYGNHDLGPRSNAVYRLVKRLRAKGAPIDGVGWQMHLTPEWPLKMADVRANLKRLEALGLEVQITELDYSIAPGSERDPKSLIEQADAYREAASFCSSEKACTGIVSWGFADGHAWFDRTSAQVSSAYYFDRDLKPKPAFYALQAGLKRIN